MPSSCSYSLGEVRMLRKRDLIANNVTDRDSSSLTVLVTRSMLTSLNDSTTVSTGERKKNGRRYTNVYVVISHFSFSCSLYWGALSASKSNHELVSTHHGNASIHRSITFGVFFNIQ